MKYSLLVIFIMLLWLIAVGRAHASDFSLAFVTSYTFYETGSASVNKKITLTNQTTNTYPAEYFLELPVDSESIVAFDDSGKTQTSIVEEGSQKKAKVVLNQETLGFGSSVTIALSYDTNTLATERGTGWSIAIPGFSSAEEIDEYTVSVAYPKSWGVPSRVIPPPNRDYLWVLTERSEAPIHLEFNPKPTTTPLPTTMPSSVIPTAVGLSIGVVSFVFLFEVLKRIV